MDDLLVLAFPVLLLAMIPFAVWWIRRDAAADRARKEKERRTVNRSYLRKGL